MHSTDSPSRDMDERVAEMMGKATVPSKSHLPNNKPETFIEVGETSHSDSDSGPELTARDVDQATRSCSRSSSRSSSDDSEIDFGQLDAITRHYPTTKVTDETCAENKSNASKSHKCAEHRPPRTSPQWSGPTAVVSHDKQCKEVKIRVRMSGNKTHEAICYNLVQLILYF